MKTMMPVWNLRPTTSHLYSDVDRLFESLFENKQIRRSGLSYDLEENNQFILFSFDLPGLEEDEVKIEVKDLILTVSGERKEDKIEDSLRSYKLRSHGVFKHQFYLPKGIATDKIEADYSKGVLKILLPKIEEEAPKKIEIKAKKGSLLNQFFKSAPQNLNDVES